MECFWTDERIAALRLLWIKGDSASIIAREMQTTRNAILGKAHRLKLKPRAPGSSSGEKLPRPKSIFKSREIKPVLRLVKTSPPPLLCVTSNITGSFITLKRRRAPAQPEMTKIQLRAMLAEAMANTAALP